MELPPVSYGPIRGRIHFWGCSLPASLY